MPKTIFKSQKTRFKSQKTRFKRPKTRFSGILLEWTPVHWRRKKKPVVIENPLSALASVREECLGTNLHLKEQAYTTSRFALKILPPKAKGFFFNASRSQVSPGVCPCLCSLCLRKNLVLGLGQQKW